MTVHVLPSGPIRTNAYLLTERQTGKAVLIDAPGEVWAQVREILIKKEGCSLEAIWLTHGHWDHMQGAAEVVRATGARVLAHEADRVLIETPSVMRDFLIPGIHLEPVSVDHWVKPGEPIQSGVGKALVRHVPGHCPGNVLFYFEGSGDAFVGDALFQAGIGRTDLPGGDFDQLERSIRTQIYTLPDPVKVWPGHGPSTTVGEEKLHNPYVVV